MLDYSSDPSVLAGRPRKVHYRTTSCPVSYSSRPTGGQPSAGVASAGYAAAAAARSLASIPSGIGCDSGLGPLESVDINRRTMPLAIRSL